MEELEEEEGTSETGSVKIREGQRDGLGTMSEGQRGGFAVKFDKSGETGSTNSRGAARQLGKLSDRQQDGFGKLSASTIRKTCNNRKRSSVTTTDSGRTKFDSQEELKDTEVNWRSGAGHRGNHGRFQCGQKVCGRSRRSGEIEIEERGAIGSDKRKCHSG